MRGELRQPGGSEAKTKEIVARHYYRPIDRSIAAKYARQFANVKLVNIDEAFGGWQKTQRLHFDDGCSFDQICKPSR